MLDGLPLGSLSNGIGVVAVIVLVGWLVFTDRLVPRGSVQRLVTMFEARLHEKDQRIDDLLDANKQSGEQAEAMTEVGRTQVQILRSIEQLAARRNHS